MSISGIPPYKSSRRVALIHAMFPNGAINDTRTLDAVIGLVEVWLADESDRLVASQLRANRLANKMREIVDILPGDPALAKTIAKSAVEDNA